ncbi:MAG TPA: tRNA-dihydrouridine synthase [Candidatus Moranbacteria bacterium]|nr:tRNA-dihydrouridine synthase [Candidatus Moranbacteria bacterium]HRZ33444.1 tRNA-dihydrouridine synthase [Candidatus Moranbacteria bacterium]
MKNFWQKLAKEKKTFFALAPMHDITDIAQRQMLVKYGKPDVLYTEFVACDGLVDKKGRKVLMKTLRFFENEHPLVAQFFGAKPENFRECAKIARKLGFDGIDINMGCPDKSIVDQGAGAALIKNPKRAREIIRATKEGAGSLPVSVKTRIGYNENEIKKWLPELLAEEPAAITVHGRTKKQMFTGKADWDAIAQAAEIAKGLGVIIIGNGDVESIKDGILKARKAKISGIMVGRRILGNPWFFNRKIKIEKISVKERLQAMIEHVKIFEKELKGIKNYDVIKKHYATYARGFDGAKELRMELMKTRNAKQTEKVVQDFLKKLYNINKINIKI